MASQTTQTTAQQQAAQQKELARKLEEYINKLDCVLVRDSNLTVILRIHYSDRYSDDEYEYRHVILPKQLLKMIPKDYFSPDESGVLRLLTEHEWRGIGITQSLGWEHYEVHGEIPYFLSATGKHLHLIAPEPHVLLFRRAKDFVVPTQQAPTRSKDMRRK